MPDHRAHRSRPVRCAVHAIRLPRQTQLVWLGNPRRRHRHGPVRLTQGSGICERPPAWLRSDHPDPSTAIPVNFRKAACWWSAHLQRASSLRREIRQADVVLSAGRHTRLPRRYRGRDTWWWLERIGGTDEATDEFWTSSARAPCPPSSSWAVQTGARSTSAHCGMRVCAFSVALVGAEGSALHLRDDLAETTGAAHAALERLLARIDTVADASGAPTAVDAVRPLLFGASPRSTSELRASAWCCGRPVIGGITRGSRSRL